MLDFAISAAYEGVDSIGRARAIGQLRDTALVAEFLLHRSRVIERDGGEIRNRDVSVEKDAAHKIKQAVFHNRARHLTAQLLPLALFSALFIRLDVGSSH